MLSTTELIIPEYCYCKNDPIKRDILAEYDIEWSSHSMAEYDVSEVDERCLKALLVGLYRGDYFSNGIMERFIRDGIVSRWLKRFK